MRNKVAKKLRKQVALKMYVGDDVSKKDVLAGIKDVYAEKQFKSVARARKKKHHDHPQTVITKVSARQQRLAKDGMVKQWPIPEPGSNNKRKMFLRRRKPHNVAK